MMEAEVSAPTARDNEIGSGNDGPIREVQRKAKLEAYLTSGCGYGRKKQKLVDDFWNIVWSGLEKAGWHKVSQSCK
jgi:hypothetical protein